MGKSFPRSVVCFLIERKDKILLTRQSPDARNAPGRWFLPGGFIEFGEPLERAVEREAKEELGVKVRFLGLAGYAEHLSFSLHAICFICRCKIIKGRIKTADDIDRAAWVKRSDFSQYPLRPLQKVVIDGKVVRELML